MKVMIGMGCDRNASLETLRQALAQALWQCGLGVSAVAGLASIDKKTTKRPCYNWPNYTVGRCFLPGRSLGRHSGTESIRGGHEIHGYTGGGGSGGTESGQCRADGFTGRKT